MKHSLSPAKAHALARGTEASPSICPFGSLPAWLLLKHLALEEQLSPAAHGGKQPLLAQRFTGPPQEAGKEVGKQLPELLRAAQGKHHLGDGTGDLQRT